MRIEEPPCILVVEDDRAIRDNLADALRQEGYRVVSARHGAEALVFLEELHPDLIVLDLVMPFMNGWTFVERYRQFPGTHAPIVVLTAVNTTVPSAQIDAQEILQKPIDLEKLLDVISVYTRYTRAY